MDLFGWCFLKRLRLGLCLFLWTKNPTQTTTYKWKDISSKKNGLFKQQQLTPFCYLLFAGVILLPITILGMFLGGYLIKKFKLHVTGMAKFACISFIVAYLLNLLYFMCNCEVLQLAGLTVPYSGFVFPWISVCCSLCHAEHGACTCLPLLS